MGRVVTNTGNPIFPAPRTIFLKELSTLALSGNAKAVLEANGDKLMATVKYGKGTVFALGDPWIYNEYVDGRRLPADFENYKAADDLSDGCWDRQDRASDDSDLIRVDSC